MKSDEAEQILSHNSKCNVDAFETTQWGNHVNHNASPGMHMPRTGKGFQKPNVVISPG